MNKEDLLNETMASLAEYLPKLIAGCQKIAEQFHTADEASAMQLLPAAIEGLEWVITAVSELQKFGLLTEIDPSKLTMHFSELESALANRDYILLGDLLEYEIVPVLEEWLDN
ncbi:MULTISPECIES: hypothetical protein [Carboxydocella]|uniref:DUF8042 domain-containing protein n=2 Tax=Carboxydocella TaxID=178898 RepID=A0A1T4QWI8_9FIRM|nr:MULTISPECIES: hypothetical protein [Carboxydocella]AVX21685.1 hypothetical protein CFE_2542 [Carboxydocella thermautotrophica]AVX32096.1 hypothetical protein CTH_2557 [Carboxydocella thermautotrophica]SKA08016.1 hypothetical protein SAMN02745885_01836 [Carboxydocella sporoproducens DSM 16521]GAW27668.1 hypothetical protein ULO1_02380 [Carboxydocella sp. ULO1]GAW31863.1 hypothetical protein JDF658_16280 [Carboxydocella sp. JDF658]